MKFCPYCGAGLNEDMRFCPSCGKPFEGSKSNPHVSAEQQELADNENITAHVSHEENYIKSNENVTAKSSEVNTSKKKHGRLFIILAVVILCAFVVGLFMSGLFSKKTVSFSDDPAAIANASNSVVMLSCYGLDGSVSATGSGFAAIEDGIIITNYHVIEQDTCRVKAQTESGDSFECDTVVTFDKKKDIAILHTNSETGLTLLTPGSTSELQKGEKVVAIGSPLGLINSVSTGVFSGYIEEEAETVLQFTAAISNGSSGGALFNDSGEVIGVTFASYVDGQNLNLAIPIDEVLSLYEKKSVSNEISIKEFYEKYEKIPVYSVEYVLENRWALNRKEVGVSGYLSAEGIIFASLDDVRETYPDTLEGLVRLRGADMEKGINIYNDYRGEKFISDNSIGDYITVRGIIKVSGNIVIITLK